MMRFLTLPSFRDDDSTVQLAELLAVVPDNAWIWSVLDFYGIGIPPNNLSMDEFETILRSKPHGFIMSWPEIKRFASSLDQTFDCLIVAAKSVEDIPSGKPIKENFGSCEVVIEAFDRTQWSVWARDSKVMDAWIETAGRAMASL